VEHNVVDNIKPEKVDRTNGWKWKSSAGGE